MLEWQWDEDTQQWYDPITGEAHQGELTTYRDSERGTRREGEDVAAYREGETVATYGDDEEGATYREGEKVSTFGENEEVTTHREGDEVAIYCETSNEEKLQASQLISVETPSNPQQKYSDSLHELIPMENEEPALERLIEDMSEKVHGHNF